MDASRFAGIRTVSALCGLASPIAAGLVLARLHLVQPAPMVGLPTLLFVVAVTFSMPVWAAGLWYSLSRGSLPVPQGTERALVLSAAVAVALFLVGFLAVLTQTEPIRTVGDWLYGGGAVVLSGLSAVVLRVAGIRGRG